MLCHIIHVAMETGVQPLEQARFGLAQVRVGDADVLKPKLNAPCTDLLRKFCESAGRGYLFALHDLQS